MTRSLNPALRWRRISLTIRQPLTAPITCSTPTRARATKRLKDRRWQVKLAVKKLVIRLIEDSGELKEQGHPACVPFHGGTQYAYKSERCRREHFSRWAESLSQTPGLLLLGWCRKRQLEAVCVSQRVENTVLYPTFFCNDESLWLDVSDLMPHSVRQAGVECGQVKSVFAGMYKGATGLDDSYLLRGTPLVKNRRCCK